MREHQTLETLVNEEALLFAKYLWGEAKAWAPRVEIARAKIYCQPTGRFG